MVWTCSLCTLENGNDQWLACDACGTPKTKPEEVIDLRDEERPPPPDDAPPPAPPIDTPSSPPPSDGAEQHTDVRAAELDDVLALGRGAAPWSGVALGAGADGRPVLGAGVAALCGRAAALRPSARRLLGRALLRKDPWQRVDCGRERCCGKCAASQLTHVGGDAARAVAELAAAGFCVLAPPDDACAAARALDASRRRALVLDLATSGAVSVDALKDWWKRLKCSGKPPGKTKDELAADLANTVAPRGKSIASFFGGAARAPACWGPLGEVLGALAKFDADAVRSLRRCRRLYATVVQGPRCAQSVAAPGNDFFSPALAVRFGKVRVGAYACGGDARPFADGDACAAYEAAVELRAWQDLELTAETLREVGPHLARRRERRLAHPGTAASERAATEADRRKERRQYDDIAKQNAESLRDGRALGAPPEDELRAQLAAAFPALDVDAAIFARPAAATAPLRGADESDGSDGSDGGGSDDDGGYDSDDSPAQRRHAFRGVLARRGAAAPATARCGLLALACLDALLGPEPRARPPAAWAPFAGASAAAVLVGVALRGLSADQSVGGTLEMASLRGPARWDVVDGLRFAVAADGALGADSRGARAAALRLGVLLGGRKAKGGGRHLRCPRARLAVVRAALAREDRESDHGVELGRAARDLWRRRNALGLDDGAFAGLGLGGPPPAYPTDDVPGGNPVARVVGEKSKCVSIRDDQADASTLYVNVERHCLEHYALEGWWGAHDEGRRLLPLFPLVLRPALFAPAPDAFVHPFQVAPRDLGRPRFYEAREALVEARLAALATLDGPGLAAALAAERRALFGVDHPFRGDHVPLKYLQALALGMGAAAVAALGRVAALRWRGSGLPDLTLLRADVLGDDLVTWTPLAPEDVEDRLVAPRAFAKSFAAAVRARRRPRRRGGGGDDDDGEEALRRDEPEAEDADDDARAAAAAARRAWLEEGLDNVFDARAPAAGALRFAAALVEVKSQNDRLAAHQELWMRDLLAAGVDARKARLTYSAEYKAEAKRRRKEQAD